MFEKINGRTNGLRRAKANARTPPSLLGIDRRIAYSQRKYHSGLMWMGVLRGFAGIKFSGSVRRFGVKVEIRSRIVNKTRNPRASFTV